MSRVDIGTGSCGPENAQCGDLGGSARSAGRASGSGDATHNNRTFPSLPMGSPHIIYKKQVATDKRVIIDMVEVQSLSLFTISTRSHSLPRHHDL